MLRISTVLFDMAVLVMEMGGHEDLTGDLFALSNRTHEMELPQLKVTDDNLVDHLRDKNRDLAKSLGHYQAENCRRASEQREQNEIIYRLARTVCSLADANQQMLRSMGYTPHQMSSIENIEMAKRIVAEV